MVERDRICLLWGKSTDTLRSIPNIYSVILAAPYQSHAAGAVTNSWWQRWDADADAGEMLMLIQIKIQIQKAW